MHSLTKKNTHGNKVAAAAAALHGREKGKYSRDDGTCVQEDNTIHVHQPCPKRAMAR